MCQHDRRNGEGQTEDRRYPDRYRRGLAYEQHVGGHPVTCPQGAPYLMPNQSSRHNPFTVKLELVRGCTMRCSFCALRTMDWAINREEYKFMDENIFYAMIDDLAR